MSDKGFAEDTYSEQLDLGLWRRLLRYTRPYRRDAILLMVLGIGVALVDVALPLVTRQVIDDVAERGAAFDMRPYVLVYGVLTATLAFCVWGFIWLAGKLRAYVSHDIRRDGFARLQELSFSFYDRRPVGWLMARMTSDCDRLSNILAWGILDFAWGMALILGIGATLLVLDFQLALIVMAVLPLLAWVSSFFKKRILKSARAVRETNSRITASYNETIMGVRTTKIFVRERQNLADFGRLTERMYRASVRNSLQSALYLPLVLVLGSLATGLALHWGGLDVTAGRISTGTLIAFLVYSRQFFEPVQQMAHWFAEMQMAQASAERILGLIASVPEIADSPEVVAAGAAARPARIGRIELEGVAFGYRDGPRVLDGFDLQVEPGETIALVGPTGGGKSTIVGLLCRFYEPTAGEIRIDGVDYRKLGLHWLQSNLGIVLQSPHLFSGTIADNIRYGKLDATDAEVEAAARLAGAHEFIGELEQGYGTEVGEGGVRLSTGQKQLLSFARAILKRPQILVMDEATSSVDTETERHIQKGLAQVLAGRTSFVIAHRLSTIRTADRILVIEGGKITESGSHRELLARRGHYHDLYTQQCLRESVASWD